MYMYMYTTTASPYIFDRSFLFLSLFQQLFLLPLSLLLSHILFFKIIIKHHTAVITLRQGGAGITIDVGGHWEGVADANFHHSPRRYGHQLLDGKLEGVVDDRDPIDR